MRPALLLCDADALFQSFLQPAHLAPLQIIKSEFSIQPVIVPEVEIELVSHRRLRRRVAPQLKKALSNSVINILDVSLIQKHTGPVPATASATLGAIQSLGSQYEKYVDFGEAYTHAAALTLGMPAMSHDLAALKALEHAGLTLPNPVIRYFDLVVLAHQAGLLSETDCDNIRQGLISEKEWIPKSFVHQSFRSGVKSFQARLVDSRKPRLGSTASSIQSSFASTIFL